MVEISLSDEKAASKIEILEEAHGDFTRDTETQREDVDMQYKVILVGPPNAGKTCLFRRFLGLEFNEMIKNTVGADLTTKRYQLSDGKIVAINLWDTAGQERFHAVTRNYFRGADAAIFVYDITCDDSLEAVKRWKDEFDSVAPNSFSLLVGNKSDLEASREVAIEVAKKWSSEENLLFLETSAKSGRNIGKAFQLLFTEIHNSRVNSYNLTDGITRPEIHPQPSVPTQSVPLSLSTTNAPQEAEFSCCGSP